MEQLMFREDQRFWFGSSCVCVPRRSAGTFTDTRHYGGRCWVWRRRRFAAGEMRSRFPQGGEPSRPRGSMRVEVIG